jgi:hypothetical protein
VFKLPLTEYLAQTLDAFAAGTKTRFMNHNDERKANCKARILLCNSGLRLGLWAAKNINPGDEIFYDYGLKGDPSVAKVHCGAGASSKKKSNLKSHKSFSSAEDDSESEIEEEISIPNFQNKPTRQQPKDQILQGASPPLALRVVQKQPANTFSKISAKSTESASITASAKESRGSERSVEATIEDNKPTTSNKKIGESRRESNPAAEMEPLNVERFDTRSSSESRKRRRGQVEELFVTRSDPEDEDYEVPESDDEPVRRPMRNRRNKRPRLHLR